MKVIDLSTIIIVDDDTDMETISETVHNAIEDRLRELDIEVAEVAALSERPL